MTALLIGENVDERADVGSLEWLHDRLGQEFPVSGDLIARAKKKTPTGIGALESTNPHQEEEGTDMNATTGIAIEVGKAPYECLHPAWCTHHSVGNPMAAAYDGSCGIALPIEPFGDGSPRSVTVTFHPEDGLRVDIDTADYWESDFADIAREIDEEIDNLRKARQIVDGFVAEHFPANTVNS